MPVQSIIIPKKNFSRAEAEKWLKSHKFIKKKMHISKNFYRFRQFPTTRGRRYRIYSLPNGIKLVLEY